MKKRFTKEIIIAVVTLISLTLLYLGVNYLKGINLFQPVNHYYVSCSNVKDLTVSSPVYVEGFKVGLVRSVEYDYTTTDKILVEISLEAKMRVNKGSYVTVERTFLSGSELHLRLNKYVDEYLKPGAVLEGRFREDMMATIQSEMVPQMIQLMPKLDSILYGLQLLVNHPALIHSLEHVEKTTAALEGSAQRLNLLLDGDLREITRHLKVTASSFAEFSDELNRLPVAAAVDTLALTLTQLKRASDQLNQSDNSLGLLLNDSTFYHNLNQTLFDASDLIRDVKEHPKRYIKIKLF